MSDNRPQIVPAQLQGNLAVGARICTQADIYETVNRVLNERLYTRMPLESLMRRTLRFEDGTEIDAAEYDDENERRGIAANIAHHELRLGKIPISEVGIIGKATLLQLEGVIVMSYDWALKRCVDEQPGCNWQLVAGVVTQMNLRRAVVVPYAGPTYDESSMFSHPASKQDAEGNAGPVPLYQRHSHVEMPDYQCSALLVFADVGRGRLQDPNALHATNPEGRYGPMTAYRTTRNLFELGAGQQRERERCEAVCREFLQGQVETRAALGVHRDEQDPAELAALRARVAELEAEAQRQAQRPDRGKPRKPAGEKKGAQVEKPPVEDPRPAVNEQVLKLSKDGFSAEQIAASLGLDLDEVKEIRREAASG